MDEFIFRNGISKKSELFWEEHNYKEYPINVAFSNVPKEKIGLYQNILKSLKITKK